MGAITIEMKKEAEKKANELSEKLGVKVNYHYVIDNNNEPVLGFFREPNRFTKRHSIDLASQSITDAGDMLLNACLVVEESDKRILSEDSENDHINLAFVLYATTLVEMANVNLEQKKS